MYSVPHCHQVLHHDIHVASAQRMNICPMIDYWENRFLGKCLVCENRSASIPSFPPIHGQDSPFLNLPIELRLQILEDVLTPVGYDTTHRLPVDYFGYRCSVIFVCRQLFFEFLPLAFRLYTFKFADLPRDHRVLRHKERTEMLKNRTCCRYVCRYPHHCPRLMDWLC